MAAFRVDRPYKYKKKGFLFWITLFLAFLIIATATMAFGLRTWYHSNLQPLSLQETSETIVMIPVGTTAQEIAELLEEKNLIRSSMVFDWYTRLNNLRNQLQAGTYKFKSSESVQQIVQRLVAGDIATDLVTILPAQRLDQVKVDFIEAGFSSEEVNAAFDASLYKNHPVLRDKPESATLEGYLYPESFSRTSDTKVEDIIRASLDETAKVLTEELRSALAQKGLSVHQAIILGSIVEREVSKSEDRPIVAQVFLTRLERGIKLGSDPTALYGALLAGLEPTVFTDTPYNTRIYAGLPPGPINNVTEESLLALANPSDTDYLFFVSGDDGNTYFSKTLEQHEALTAKHCIELCKSY